MSELNLPRIEPLVEKLGSEDAFERLRAIEKLKEVTRQTLGFRFNDPPDLREAAVRRWKELIDVEKREAAKTEKLEAAIHLTGAKIDVDALKQAIEGIPTEKIQGYLNALVMKMKAKQARCDACNVRQATVRVTEVAGAKISTRHLCDLCARERGDVLV